VGGKYAFSEASSDGTTDTLPSDGSLEWTREPISYYFDFVTKSEHFLI
jgi:hypothetical protein